MHYYKIASFLAIILPIIYASDALIDHKNDMSDISKREFPYYDYIGEVVAKTTQFGQILAWGAFGSCSVGVVALLSRAYFKYYCRIHENVAPQTDLISEFEGAFKNAIYAAMSVIVARNIAGEVSGYEKLEITVNHYLYNSGDILGPILNCYYMLLPILVKQIVIIVVFWLVYKILCYLIRMRSKRSR